MFNKRAVLSMAILSGIWLCTATNAEAQIIFRIRPIRVFCPLVWNPLNLFVDPRTSTGIEGAAGSVINNKIYVSHGFRGGDSSLLSVYDIGTNTWTHGLPYADPVIPRSEMGGGKAYGRHQPIGGGKDLPPWGENEPPYEPLDNNNPQRA